MLEDEDKDALLAGAPYLIGAGHLDSHWLVCVWERLNLAFSEEMERYKGSAAEYFLGKNPDIYFAGKVYFHLVESKKEDYPFAFMATYAAEPSTAGKAKHLPLKNSRRRQCCRHVWDRNGGCSRLSRVASCNISRCSLSVSSICEKSYASPSFGGGFFRAAYNRDLFAFLFALLLPVNVRKVCSAPVRTDEQSCKHCQTSGLSVPVHCGTSLPDMNRGERRFLNNWQNHQ